MPSDETTNGAPPFPLRNSVPELGGGETICEPARDIPVLTHCDVAVFGGGPAGIAAAAAAARQGARVVLVERYGFLGGMATAGSVTILHSLYGTDGATKVIGGIPEELIRRLQHLRAIYNHHENGETGPWVVCTETAKLVCDDLVLGSGARLLLHSLLAGCLREDRRITAAIVEGKGGRQAILAKAYVDCTGDADLIRRAGIGTQLGDAEGKCQAPSLCFRVRGHRRDAIPLSEVQVSLFEEPMDYNGEHYPTFLWGSGGVHDRAELMMAGTRVLNVNAADPLDLSRAEIEARYQLRWVLGKLKSMPGWEDVYLAHIATQIGVRESHRAIADHQLTREEVLHGVEFPDAIAQGTYPIDIHRPDGPGIYFEHLDGTTRRIHGDRSTEAGRWDGQSADAPPRKTLCYQVPYRSLVPRELDNVLVAGRCIGANHDSAGAIRVMVNCMQAGQAAGTAAALALAAGGAVREVDTQALQARLAEAGVPFRAPAGTKHTGE